MKLPILSGREVLATLKRGEEILKAEQSITNLCLKRRHFFGHYVWILGRFPSVQDRSCGKSLEHAMSEEDYPEETTKEK